jgi:hypothetical protein
VNSSSFTTIKMREIYECSFITTRLIATKNWDSVGVKYSIGNSDDISFEMISENTTNTLIQLDSVRSRQNKFICINDNIESDKSNHIDLILHNFLESFWPKPSIFELPSGYCNRYLRYDKYRKGKENHEPLTHQCVYHQNVTGDDKNDNNFYYYCSFLYYNTIFMITTVECKSRFVLTMALKVILQAFYVI